METPRKKKRPSSFKLAVATREVPGQKPPTMKPAPMISPPTIPGAR